MMNILHAPLAIALMVSSVLAFAAQPAVPSEPDSSVKQPRANGIAKPRGSSVETPKNSGIIVNPPVVDPKTVKTPPRNIDPKINDATDDIDRKNRKKSEDKTKGQ